MSLVLKIGVSLLGIWSAFAVAGELTLSAENYGENPAALALIEELVQEEGFDRTELTTLFAQVEGKESILKAMSRPAEKTKPWYDYRKIFVTSKREKEGVEFYAIHKQTFLRAEQEFGVPAEIILSIMGVETCYGRKQYKCHFYPDKCKTYLNIVPKNTMLNMQFSVNDIIYH